MRFATESIETIYNLLKKNCVRRTTNTSKTNFTINKPGGRCWWYLHFSPVDFFFFSFVFGLPRYLFLFLLNTDFFFIWCTNEMPMRNIGVFVNLFFYFFTRTKCCLLIKFKKNIQLYPLFLLGWKQLNASFVFGVCAHFI